MKKAVLFIFTLLLIPQVFAASEMMSFTEYIIEKRGPLLLLFGCISMVSLLIFIYFKYYHKQDVASKSIHKHGSKFSFLLSLALFLFLFVQGMDIPAYGVYSITFFVIAIITGIIAFPKMRNF